METSRYQTEFLNINTLSYGDHRPHYAQPQLISSFSVNGNDWSVGTANRKTFNRQLNRWCTEPENMMIDVESKIDLNAGYNEWRSKNENKNDFALLSIEPLIEVRVQTIYYHVSTFIAPLTKN